jgi:hypothetical protein
MALVVYDRVQETTSTTGTGSVTLNGAVSGFQSFAVVGNGNTTFYTIVNGNQWEVGLGTYTSSGTILSRDTIYSNSNGNTSPITLSGSSFVFVTYPAGRSVNLNASGNVTALGTVSSGTWQGSTVGVAYGGTGVTASSGANSVVLRDANANVTFNNFTSGFTAVTAAAGTTVLTVASARTQVLIGSTTQTIQLPDATTLQIGQSFVFVNNSSGALTITNNASATIDVVPAGGAVQIGATSIATNAGTWGIYSFLPGTYNFSIPTADFGNATITNAVWNGTTIASGYGGTGLTTFTGANNALYSSGASTLTAGTLPVAAGGTGVTTLASGRVPYGNGTGAINSASTFVFDGTNLGVGTATPSAKIDVVGNAIVNNGTGGSNSLMVGTSVNNSGTAFNTVEVNGSTYSALYLKTSDVNRFSIFQVSNSYTAINTLGSTPLTLGTNDTERMRITSAGGISFGSSGTAYGTSGQVLQSNGDTTPTWVTPAAATTFSAGTTGFTPSTATSGAVTLAGTLAVANGGTGQTSYTNGQLLIGNTTGNTLTKATLTAGLGISISNGTGSITITNTAAPYNASYVIIAGGGSGGGAIGSDTYASGGGGAGGYISGTQTLLAGTTYSFTVGAGGVTPNEGGNSIGFGLTAIGGAPGVPVGSGNSKNGGSGGGGGDGVGTADTTGGTGTVGQGNNGGNASGAQGQSGGGGGAGAAGSGAQGGAGTASSITGSSVTRAGGGSGTTGTTLAGGAGGGGSGGLFANSTAGTANTGGGGGGSRGGSGATQLGKNGGSGVVILSMPTANYTGTTTGSPTVTTSGSNTILQFNSSGSYTA